MRAVIQTAGANITGVPRPIKRILWTVGIIFLLIIAVLAFFKLRGKVDEIKKRKHVSYTADGGEVAENFPASEYADKMFKVMDGVSTPPDSKNFAARDLMQLNDNQLIAVHNYWNQHLYDRNKETMYEMMKHEWITPNATTTSVALGQNWWDQLLNRLSKLNLITK